jgi:hypothetical protein
MSDLSDFELRRHMRMQEEVEKEMTKAMNRASNAPHTVERHLVFASGVEEREDGHCVLILVLPDGRQHHFEMRPQLRQNLASELAGEAPKTSVLEVPNSDA